MQKMSDRRAQTTSLLHLMCIHLLPNAGLMTENLFQNHSASNLDQRICDDNYCKHVTFKIEEAFVTLELSSCMINDKVDIAALKVDIACWYFLQLHKQKRLKGLLPIIHHLKCSSKVLDSLESTETFKDYFLRKGWIDVSVDGNENMEKLQQLFTSSTQKYGGLILDLHQNRCGPTALFQICECPVLFSRLEVLNISGNRLTDSCASYLANILRSRKALYVLNIGNCSITSRTVLKIADSLDPGSSLVQLCLGYNNSISGNAIVNLLAKLATLDRFAELNLNGLKLNKAVVNGICQLARTSCLSELMLQGTSIGTDGALLLMESLSSETREPVKLDVSSCGMTSQYIFRINAEISLISGVIELNLEGNPITQEISVLPIPRLKHLPVMMLVLQKIFVQLTLRVISLKLLTASEDDEVSTKPSRSGINGSGVSFSQKDSSNMESRFIQELSRAISGAKAGSQ